jgi:hypothetical protein
LRLIIEAQRFHRLYRVTKMGLDSLPARRWRHAAAETVQNACPLKCGGRRHPQGRRARPNFSAGAADQVRACHQSQNRKALDRTIPLTLLVAADEVIE